MNTIEPLLKPRGRGRPRKYLLDDPHERHHEAVAKYHKENAEAIRQKNRENYAKKQLYIAQLERIAESNHMLTIGSACDAAPISI